MNGPMNVFSGEAAGPNCRVRGRRGGGGGGRDGDGGAPGEAHRGQPELRRVRAGRAGVAVRRPRPRAMRGWSSTSRSSASTVAGSLSLVPRRNIIL